MFSEFRVSQLFVYPIKGLAGVSVSKTRLTERGFEWDRRWMLIDENNVFISQRTVPQMTLFKIALDKDQFKVIWNKQIIHIPFELKMGKLIKATIWDDAVDVLEAENIFSRFFSDILNLKCRLVYMPNSSSRLVDKSVVKNDYQVSFADSCPILIIGQESLNLLNSKLEEPLEIERFRPNIVFLGGLAHDEDYWKEFAIADAQFQFVKLCGRCQVITINRKTGHTSKEPMTTLATYRTVNNKINFGQKSLIKKSAEIAIGNTITILQ